MILRNFNQVEFLVEKLYQTQIWVFSCHIICLECIFNLLKMVKQNKQMAPLRALYFNMENAVLAVLMSFCFSFYCVYSGLVDTYNSTGAFATVKCFSLV